LYICVKCKQEMVCKKTGMIARWGESHCYAGDKFECPECKSEILACNTNSFHGTHPIAQEILVQMD
jgi:DNA-directed RNA polymerase subunit RPC12/RpoP